MVNLVQYTGCSNLFGVHCQMTDAEGVIHSPVRWASKLFFKVRKLQAPDSRVHSGQIRKSLKRLGPQIANPQSATFAEGPKI